MPNDVGMISSLTFDIILYGNEIVAVSCVSQNIQYHNKHSMKGKTSRVYAVFSGETWLRQVHSVR